MSNPTEPFGGNQQNNNNSNNINTFLVPPSSTNPGQRNSNATPLGNTQNPNRMSNTNRLVPPVPNTTSTNKSVNNNNDSFGNQQKPTVTTNTASNTNQQRFGYQQRQQQPRQQQQNANINTNNNNNNNNNNIDETAIPLDLLRPTFWESTKRYIIISVFWVRALYRRLLSIPFFFGFANYFFPFVLELAILSIHFDEIHRLPSDTPFLGWSWFPRLRTYVVADAIIGTILLAKFVFYLTVAFLSEGTSMWRAVISVYSIASIVILPMMMYPGFVNGAAAFSKNSVSPTSEAVWRASVGKITTSTLDMIKNGEIIFSVPSVSAWRIWLINDIVQTLIFASSTVSKSFRAIVFQLSFIFTLFFNCMSTMQLIFCVENEKLVDLGTSFYFTTVTLTTVGYGDYVPTSPLGRAFIITQIFAAMLAVPLLLAETDRLMKFLLSLTGYAGSDRHIIIFGELTEAEMDHLLSERCDGDGASDPVHLVFVAPRFSQDTQEKVTSCSKADQITLCVAHQLSRTELTRFSPNRGDAALFFSNTQAAAMRGDYRTIAAAAAVRLNHPSLPQYLMMRRTDTAHLVEGAFVVFDRDFLRAALLGTSLQVPGFLPMFLNLIRHVPAKHVREDPIMKEYKRRRKELDEIETEAKRRIEEGEDESDHEGVTTNFYHYSSHQQNGNAGGGGGLTKKMKEQAILLKMKQLQQQNVSRNGGSSSGGGSSSRSSTPLTRQGKKKSFLFKYQQRRSPHQAREKTKDEEERERASNINNQSWYNMYLNGARQNIYTITVPEVLIGRTFVVASFIVQLRTGALPIGLVRDSKVALNAGNTPIAELDSFIVIATSWEDLYTRFSRFPTTSTNTDTIVTKMALRGKAVHFETEHHETATSLWLANYHNCFPFQNHVILVDLASFVSQPELCPEESYQREQFQVRDMLALASRFPKWQSFVLLSLNPVSDLLQQEWANAGRQPIFHIMKSPQDPEALRLCRVGACMSVLIFSSLHVSSDNDDHFKSAMLAVNREVMLAVQVETAGKLKKSAAADTTAMNNIPQQQRARGTSAAGEKEEDHHPTVITVIGNPREALLLSPEQVSFQGETIEHDAHCCAFATGGALAPSLLDGLMFRTYYNEYLPLVIELLLEPNSIVRERASILAPTLFDDEIDKATRKMRNGKKNKSHHQNKSRKRRKSTRKNRRNYDYDEDDEIESSYSDSDSFSSSASTDSDDDGEDTLGSDADEANRHAANSLYHDFGNRRLPTFGQLCRVMTAGKFICFGFTRVIQTPERGVDTLGKVFFVTNPELGTLIMPDDFIFYLPPWNQERLAEELFL